VNLDLAWNHLEDRMPMLQILTSIDCVMHLNAVKFSNMLESKNLCASCTLYEEQIIINYLILFLSDLFLYLLHSAFSSGNLLFSLPVNAMLRTDYPFVII